MQTGLTSGITILVRFILNSFEILSGHYLSVEIYIFIIPTVPATCLLAVLLCCSATELKLGLCVGLGLGVGFGG